MATRRDQLQSYQFLTQRVISAFVMRETDPPQSPLRRGIGAMFAGVMIAVLVAAGFGVYGLLTKIGGDDWQTDGAVVVERETGATFVYSEDELHPTLNYASALLASGQPQPAVFRVASATLAGVPRAVTIGIPGAPDSLPAAAEQAGYPWTMCTQAGEVTLVVADAPAGSRRLAEGGVLVRDAAAATTYLVWHGRRYLLRDPELVVPALFGAVVTPVPAGTSWLNALPAGADIGPIPVAGRGRPATAVPGRTVGELLVAETGSGPQYYLVFGDGLAAITPLQAAIAAAQATDPPAPVSISEATDAPTSDGLAEPAGEVQPPGTPPELVTPDGSELLCAVTSSATDTPDVQVGGAVEGYDQAIPTGSVSTAGGSLADRVYLPAGRVAVVRATGAPDAGTGYYHVVTDLCVRYPVPSSEALMMLGYPPELAVEVPAGLVNKIPAGPTLDPAEATTPAGIGTG